MPTFLTVLIGKFILKFNRLLGLGGGSALPGLVAEKIDPKILKKLAARIPKGSIIITGTNGKTTTTKMAAEILRSSGYDVVTNSGGSNLSRGIISTLIEKVRLLPGKEVRLLGLFEVDEAAMPAVAAAVKPSVIIVLNLFRDQLDRYGELDRTASLIGGAIAATSAKVYLNADDPLVASLAKYARKPDKVVYFGVDETKTKKLKNDHTADSIHCPVCGRRLKYEQEFFAHLGHYSCPNRDFKRPKPQITEDGERKTEKIRLQLPGLYNQYNALGALAVADALDVDRPKAVKVLENVAAAFGRVEQVTIDGKHIYLLLIKNPTGFNQIIQTFLADKQPKKLLIAINDLFADGRDVSWLWDAAIEELTGKQLRVTTSGTRAYDMALRLKYAEVKSNTEADLSKAVDSFIGSLKKGETGYVLPTYTAMLAIRKMISDRAGLEGFWK